MKIPKQLKVGGHVFKVWEKYRFQDRSDRCGQSEIDELRIKITHMTQNGTLRPRSQIEQTFIHEMLHCVDGIYNNHKLTEDDVSRISEGLYQVLQDNRLLK